MIENVVETAEVEGLRRVFRPSEHVGLVHVAWKTVKEMSRQVFSFSFFHLLQCRCILQRESEEAPSPPFSSCDSGHAPTCAWQISQVPGFCPVHSVTRAAVTLTTMPSTGPRKVLKGKMKKDGLDRKISFLTTLQNKRDLLHSCLIWVKLDLWELVEINRNTKIKT